MSITRRNLVQKVMMAAGLLIGPASILRASLDMEFAVVIV